MLGMVVWRVWWIWWVSMHNKIKEEEHVTTVSFVKQAESPACTKNRVLTVAEAFQSLLWISIKHALFL